MDFRIDFESKIPIFKQIENRIIDAIDNDEFNNGGKLPTERTLCQQFNVSRGTIKKVFDELEQMGKIRKVQGKGTFATGNHMHEKREFIIDSMRDLINNLCSVNFNELQIKDIVMKELWKRLKDDEKLSVAWVDCSSELLKKSSQCISDKCNVKVKSFLIDKLRENPEAIIKKFDFIATTINHVDELKEILCESDENIESVILRVSNKTISDIAGIKEKDKVAVIYESSNFLHLVKENLSNISNVDFYKSIEITNEIDTINEEIQGYNIVIVSEEYYEFIKSNLKNVNMNIIAFEYILDDGSLVNLLDKAEKYWVSKCVK